MAVPFSFSQLTSLLGNEGQALTQAQAYIQLLYVGILQCNVVEATP